MKAKETTKQTDERQPFRARLPGFITEKEIGLGDVIKRATSALGSSPVRGMRTPCSGAEPLVRFHGMALEVRQQTRATK